MSVQALQSRYVNSSKKTTHIIITHGKIVAKAANHASQYNVGTKWEEKVVVKRIVPYTGIACLNIKGNECLLTKGGENSHLK